MNNDIIIYILSFLRDNEKLNFLVTSRSNNSLIERIFLLN